MSVVAGSLRPSVPSAAPAAELPSVSRARPYPTTRVERLLLAAIIMVLPLEDHIPTVGGMSTAFLLFALLTAYAVLHRSSALGRIWLHPVFVATYVFLIVAALIESVHPNPRYEELRRLLLMIVGGVVFASYCRDRKALQTALYAYVIGSVWLSVIFFTTTYGALQQASAGDYYEASAVRSEVSKEIFVEGNLNQMAFLAAEGGVVALALTLTAPTLLQRLLFLGAGLFCIVGAFLPMSRSAITIVGGACVAVLYNCKGKRLRSLVAGVILLAAIATWVPHVVFSRMEVDVEGGRKRTYSAAVEALPEYVLVGVGAGNFWNNVRFTRTFDGVLAHNVFLQVTINWGLPGLFAVLAVIAQAYWCLPKNFGKDRLTLALSGVAVACLIMMVFSHGFWDKWYSMSLGLLVGGQIWIWPAAAHNPRSPLRQ